MKIAWNKWTLGWMAFSVLVLVAVYFLVKSPSMLEGATTYDIAQAKRDEMDELIQKNQKLQKDIDAKGAIISDRKASASAKSAARNGLQPLLNESKANTEAIDKLKKEIELLELSPVDVVKNELEREKSEMELEGRVLYPYYQQLKDGELKDFLKNYIFTLKQTQYKNLEDELSKAQLQAKEYDELRASELVETFDLISTEGLLKRGKQSNGVPVTPFMRESSTQEVEGMEVP